MGRSLVAQIRGVWSASRIFTAGKSRFEEKGDVREKLRAAGTGATSARIAAATGICSYRTYDAYREVSDDFARFAEAHGVRDVRDLRPEHAADFLREKLAAGLSCNSLRTYAAALGKLDNALGRAPRKMHIPASARILPGVEEVRAQFNREAPRLDQERRAYFKPAAVVEAMRDDAHRLIGRVQLTGGLRISEALGLRRQDLRGETSDPVLGTPCGEVSVKGKGGFRRSAFLPAPVYRELAEHLCAAGGTQVEYKSYLEDLRQAADSTGDLWGGSHGLRHSYARGFLTQAATVGLTSEDAMREASERLGHHRLSILKIYCR